MLKILQDNAKLLEIIALDVAADYNSAQYSLLEAVNPQPITCIG